MSRPVTHAIVLPLVIKPQHTKDWEEFVVNQGPPGVRQEPDTIIWIATHIGENKYALVDFFPHEEGRKAHLEGAVAAAVFGHADWFAEPPQPLLPNVIAQHHKTSPEKTQGPTAGIKFTLRVILKAKADKINDVREFLKGAVPLVEEEPATAWWSALEIPGTNTFAILDAFPDEAGRQAHLNGKVAAALFANADALLEVPPVVTQATVLAATVNWD